MPRQEEEKRRFREYTIARPASLGAALRRTTTYSIDLNDKICRGPKSLEERPTSGVLRKRAFSWSAWAEAHPTHAATVPDLHCRLRLPGPGFVRLCPALPGSSEHGVLAPENPADRTAVRARRLPGRTSHPWPTPLNRLFCCSLRPGRAPGGELSTPGTGTPPGPGIVTARRFRPQLAYYGVQKSVTVPNGGALSDSSR